MCLSSWRHGISTKWIQVLRKEGSFPLKKLTPPHPPFNTHNQKRWSPGTRSRNYYPPEVRRGKYWGLGVFLLQYFPLVKIWMPLHYNARKLILLGSKNKKHLRGSTQATIHPLAIILTVALWALVSITAYGSIVGAVLWPSYCLLCVSYISIHNQIHPEQIMQSSWIGWKKCTMESYRYHCHLSQW